MYIFFNLKSPAIVIAFFNMNLPSLLRKLGFPQNFLGYWDWGRGKKKWCSSNINIFVTDFCREFQSIWMFPLNMLKFLATDLWLWFLSHSPWAVCFRSDTSVGSETKSRKYDPQRQPGSLHRGRGLQSSLLSFCTQQYTNLCVSEYFKNKICMNLKI